MYIIEKAKTSSAQPTEVLIDVDSSASNDSVKIILPLDIYSIGVPCVTS